MKRNNKSQHITQDDLLFFDELNAEERKRTEEHLKDCYACSEKHKEVLQIQAKLKLVKKLKHIENKVLTRFVIMKSGAETTMSKPDLTARETKSTEAHLQKCPLCREEYNILMKEYSDIGNYLDKTIKQEWLTAERARSNFSFEKIRNIWQKIFRSRILQFAPLRLSSAIAVLVLGLIGIYLVMKSPDNKYKSLAQIEAPVYTPPEILRDPGSSELGAVNFRRGMSFYGVQQYDEAIKYLQKTVESKPDYAEARFYLGVCFLLEKRPDQAIEHLDRATGTENAELVEKIYWYSGKAYLRIGDVENALRAFNRVVRTEGKYYNKAGEIILEIENLR